VDSEPIEPSRDSASARPGWLAAVAKELRSRPLTYLAVAGLVALGPVAARMIFPEASIELVLFGGVTLGGFFGFCALADKLFE
jgi:hypothetical protein